MEHSSYFWFLFSGWETWFTHLLKMVAGTGLSFVSMLINPFSAETIQKADFIVCS